MLSLRERPIDSTTWTFVVNDLETGNEAAAKNERSSGRIVVSRWGCERGDAVEVTFKAVVGSEFGDGEVVRAAGTVTTEIGDPRGSSTACASVLSLERQAIALVPITVIASRHSSAWRGDATIWRATGLEPATSGGDDQVVVGDLSDEMRIRLPDWRSTSRNPSPPWA